MLLLLLFYFLLPSVRSHRTAVIWAAAGRSNRRFRPFCPVPTGGCFWAGRHDRTGIGGLPSEESFSVWIWFCLYLHYDRFLSLFWKAGSPGGLSIASPTERTPQTRSFMIWSLFWGSRPPLPSILIVLSQMPMTGKQAEGMLQRHAQIKICHKASLRMEIMDGAMVDRKEERKTFQPSSDLHVIRCLSPSWAPLCPCTRQSKARSGRT